MYVDPVVPGNYAYMNNLCCRISQWAVGIIGLMTRQRAISGLQQAQSCIWSLLFAEATRQHSVCSAHCYEKGTVLLGRHNCGKVERRSVKQIIISVIPRTLLDIHAAITFTLVHLRYHQAAATRYYRRDIVCQYLAATSGSPPTISAPGSSHRKVILTRIDRITHRPRSESTRSCTQSSFCPSMPCIHSYRAFPDIT